MGVGDDKRLVERCVERAPGAGEEFLERFQGVIWRTIHHFTRGASHDERQDVFQEVLLDLFAKGLASFRGTCPLEGYVRVVAANKARSLVRRLARGGPRELPPDPIGDSFDPTKVELEGLLLEAFDGLGEPCHTLIQLRVFEEKKPREIAPVLGLKPNTVSVKVKRCLAELRARIEGTGWEPEDDR